MVATEDSFADVIEALYVQLMDHINDLRPPISYNDLTSKCQRAIDRAENLLAGHPEWPNAKYAIIAWVDAEIRSVDDEWKNRALERLYTQSYEAYDRFFAVAQDSVIQKSYQACECFYLSFMFGYRGVYEEDNNSRLGSGWPKTKREWQKNMAGLIRNARRQRLSDVQWNETFECPVAPEVEELSGPGLLRSGLSLFALTLLVAVPFALFVLLTFWAKS